MGRRAWSVVSVKICVIGGSFNHQAHLGGVATFQNFFEVCVEIIFEIVGRGRTAIGEQRLFQFFQVHGELGQTGERLLDGREKFRADFIRQFLGRHEILEQLFLRTFKQLEISLNDRIVEVFEQVLGPALVDFFQAGFQAGEPGFARHAGVFHAGPEP